MPQFLPELVVIAIIAVGVAVLLSRIKIPTITGLLAAGILLGPKGIGLVQSIEPIENLAEIGVILLLFSIGLELSIKRIQDIFKQVALAGTLQVGLTVVVISVFFGLHTGQYVEGLVYGFVFALSSTAIVLRSLSDRNEIHAPHGRLVVGTLIFQDLCVVPMMLLIPLLAEGEKGGPRLELISLALAKAALMVVLTLFASRFLVPRFLSVVARSQSREVFLLAILSICIGTAWLSALAGLSLALGAFLGGVVVADSEYGHRAMGDIIPLREVFMSFFFISLGMLFDYQAVLNQPGLAAGLFFLFTFGKGILTSLVGVALSFPSRVAWLTGVGLAQFGEFGFVLAKTAQEVGLFTSDIIPPLFAAGIGSMIFAPLAIRLGSDFKSGERFLRPFERKMKSANGGEIREELTGYQNHVIVVGFGVAGRLTTRALQAADIPHVVLDLNQENVQDGRAKGYPIYFGDATSEDVLKHIGIQRARMLILLMNDPTATIRVVEVAKRFAPDLNILIRSRYIRDRESIKNKGASDVVVEEVEGSIEVITRVLRAFQLPRNKIDGCLAEIRSETQASERKLTLPRPTFHQVQALGDLKVETLYVQPSSLICGRAPSEFRFRSESGALIIAIKREGVLLDQIDPHQPLQKEDLVYLVGKSEAIRRATEWF